MRAALVLVLVTAPTLSGCVIDRSPIATGGSIDTGGVADRDAAEEPGLDAASTDDAELPDAFETLDARVELDARVADDAYAPDAFVPGDTPVCVAETCNRRDDDCDDLVDEAGCATGSGDCTAHTLDRHVYLVCPNLLSWTASHDDCASRGYTLVEIESAAEGDEIARWIPGDSWIGLNDRDEEGTFVWVDGSSADYTAWSGSEPNDFFGEDCTLVRPNGKWNDAECDDGHTFVCEAEILPR